MTRVTPVIHIGGVDRTLFNVHICVEEGVDGVFLINHGVEPDYVIECAYLTHDEFPDLWVGINRLGTPTEKAFNGVPDFVGGVWVDNAYIPGSPEEDDSPMRHVGAEQERSGWKGLYFGGTAFKYQKQPKDLVYAVKEAAKWVDVITTSGPGTGKAADVDRIRMMKEAAGGTPLAIASGVTPDNVQLYTPYVNWILVATGISRDFWTLDRGLLRRLLTNVRDEH